MKAINNFSTQDVFIFKNEGILNSVYKQETKHIFFKSHPKSIFGIKQRVKDQRYRIVRLVPALLKLMFWAIVIITLINI